MSVVNDTVQAVLKKVVELAPEALLPGQRPDPIIGTEHKYVGQPIPRLDGPLKVAGRAPFAAERTFDNMLHASIACSTIGKGRIKEIHSEDARAASGVRLIMTHQNAPRLHSAPAFLSSELGAAGDNIAVMQDDRIYWNGQPIAIVLAETEQQAEYAASLIYATYIEESAVTGFDAHRHEAKPAPPFPGSSHTAVVGDVAPALDRAAYKVDNRYRTSRHVHHAIELHAVTLGWFDNDLIIHDASQLVTATAWTLGKVFGIDQSRIKVTSPFVGGGFGGKAVWWHHILAAAASREIGRPVRIVLSRREVFQLVGGRTMSEQRVAIGADAHGNFRAMVHEGLITMTQHNAMPEPVAAATQCLYRSETFRTSVDVIYLDMPSNTFMRAPGEGVGTFALECAVDELAEAMGLDPIELRLRNEPERDPIDGRPFSSRHLVEAYRTGARRFGWDARRPMPQNRKEGSEWVGLGVASATYPYQRMPNGAARLTMNQDGKLLIEVAAHEMGMGTATVHTQVAADRLGLTMDAVTFHYGSSTFPGNAQAGGSQQTVQIGAAVAAGCRKLVSELLNLLPKTAPLSGLGPDEVNARDGGLASREHPEKHESYVSIFQRAGQDFITINADAPPPIENIHWSMHSYGAIFCEARVSEMTREVRVTRLLGSFDCGKILNPKTAASQFRGAMVMGLGMALSEGLLFDERTGRIMNPSMLQYHAPNHADVPDIDVLWTDIPDPCAPMGARGLGEIGTTGVAAAVANAIYNAVGRRVRQVPIQIEQLL